MNIECKKGGVSYQEFLELIDRVFVNNTCPFETLLPKLYKPELAPQDSTYFVTVDGVARGSVGMYTRTLVMGEESLTMAGIGNVSCEKEYEGKGFMRLMMTQAQKEMTENGADLSDLGGSRHRYAFYGYECGGVELVYTLDDTNMRRAVINPVPLTFRPLEKEDIPKALKLYNSHSLRILRREESFMDDCRSWNRVPVAVCKDGAFAGYYVPDGNKIREVYMEDSSLYPSLFSALVARLPEECHVYTSPARDICGVLYGLCDHVILRPSENFLILNYKNVIRAALKLKGTYDALPDGSWNLLIHGYRADEHLKITVSAGAVSVEDTSEPAETELSHMEAQSLLFAPIDLRRGKLPALWQAWLPLPLYVDETDHV